jgi:hypothetical protein
LIAQSVAAARLGPHVVLLRVNSPALLLWFVVMATLLMTIGELDVLLRVSVSVLLTLLTI